MESRKKWYWWTSFQGRNRETDMKNRLMDTAGDGEGGMNWENSTELYTLSYVKWQLVGSCCITQGALPGALWLPRGMGWWGGGRFKREGIYVYDWFTLLYGRKKPTQQCKALILQLKLKTLLPMDANTHTHKVSLFSNNLLFYSVNLIF